MGEDKKPLDGSEPNNGEQIAPEWAHYGTAPGEGIKLRNKRNRKKVFGSNNDGQCLGVDIDPWTGR
jgi:hypothetical protein